MNTAMQSTPSAITEQQRNVFARDGLVKVPGLLSQDWLDLLAQAIAEIRAKVIKEHPEAVDAGSCYSENSWTFNDKIKRFVFESDIAAAAAGILCSKEIRLFETLVIYRAQGGAGTPWHQDITQHGISGKQTCS